MRQSLTLVKKTKMAFLRWDSKAWICLKLWPTFSLHFHCHFHRRKVSLDGWVRWFDSQLDFGTSRRKGDQSQAPRLDMEISHQVLQQFRFLKIKTHVNIFIFLHIFSFNRLWELFWDFSGGAFPSFPSKQQ